MIPAAQASEDRVLPSLLTAGMTAALAVTTANSETPDAFQAGLLEDITRLVGESYGYHTLFRELCCNAALVLIVRKVSVCVGEIIFRREGDIWTFDLDVPEENETTAGLRRAAQLTVVYANMLTQMSAEDAGTSDNNAWNSLFLALPAHELMPIGCAMFAVSGILFGWSKSR